MAWEDDVAKARDQAAALLVEITQTPKPTYNVCGKMIGWTEYARMLREQISGCNKLIAQGTPVEEIGIGI